MSKSLNASILKVFSCLPLIEYCCQTFHVQECCQSYIKNCIFKFYASIFIDFFKVFNCLRLRLREYCCQTFHVQECCQSYIKNCIFKFYASIFIDFFKVFNCLRLRLREYCCQTFHLWKCRRSSLRSFRRPPPPAACNIGVINLENVKKMFSLKGSQGKP